MKFIIRATFRPGGAEERFAIRVPHIEYMMAALPFTVVGGPRLTDEEGSSALGLMVVVELPNNAAAQRFIDGEPYRQAGLFQSIEIEPFKHMTSDLLEAELMTERAKQGG